MLDFEIEVLSTRQHCSQVAAGFLMLAQRLGPQRMRVSFSNGLADKRYPNHSVPVLVVRGGGKVLAYDQEDWYWTLPLMSDLLDECDLYFKRSLQPDVNEKHFSAEQCAKMRPLGLNYFVDYPGSPYAWRCLPFSESTVRRVAKRLRAMQEGRLLPECFEREPGIGPDGPRAVFFARLWDPAEVDERYKADREQVNATRIQIVRTLREELGPRFEGGLVGLPFARKVAPDLVVPDAKTRRGAYLSTMQAADVCIGTTGLHGSIGCKVGEYVAASRGIVTEPLLSVVPGDFSAGCNYLEWRTPDECVEAVMGLIGDPDRLLAMQRANREYYLAYLRPDVLVERTLREAGLL